MPAPPGHRLQSGTSGSMKDCKQEALVLCPAGNGTDHRLLGLKVGERLLLTLANAGVRRVCFEGGGPRPTSRDVGLEVVDRPADDSDLLVVAADAVLDCSLLQIGRVADDLSEKKARRALLRSLRKPIDGIVAKYLNRHVSLALSPIFVRFGVAPNVLTVVFTLVGLTGGLLAWIAEPWWALVLAGTLVQLQSILDGCDGEVARLTFRFSKVGQWLDSIGDDLTNYAFCFGLAAGQARVLQEPLLYWAGGVTLTAQCLASAVLYRRLRILGTGDLLAIPDTLTGHGGRATRWLRLLSKRDTFIFLAALLCALQLPLFAFGLFAVGTYPMLVAVLINDRRIARSSGQSPQKS